MLDLVKLEVALTDELLDTARGADHAMWRLCLQKFLVLLDRDTTVENRGLKLCEGGSKREGRQQRIR